MSDRSTRSTPPTVAPDAPDLEGVGDKEVAQRLAMAFATFMVGQTHPSESDYPLRPVLGRAAGHDPADPEGLPQPPRLRGRLKSGNLCGLRSTSIET